MSLAKIAGAGPLRLETDTSERLVPALGAAPCGSAPRDESTSGESSRALAIASRW